MDHISSDIICYKLFSYLTINELNRFQSSCIKLNYIYKKLIQEYKTSHLNTIWTKSHLHSIHCCNSPYCKITSLQFMNIKFQFGCNAITINRHENDNFELNITVNVNTKQFIKFNNNALINNNRIIDFSIAKNDRNTLVEVLKNFSIYTYFLKYILNISDCNNKSIYEYTDRFVNNPYINPYNIFNEIILPLIQHEETIILHFTMLYHLIDIIPILQKGTSIYPFLLTK